LVTLRTCTLISALATFEPGAVDAPTESKLPRTTAPFRPSQQGLASLWRDDLKTPSPQGSTDGGDKEFRAVAPELRTLSLPRNQPLLRLFLKMISLPEGEAESPRAGAVSEPNSGLMVLSAACRVGLFEVRRGKWARTAFGESFSEAWTPPARPLDLLTRRWLPRLAAPAFEEILSAVTRPPATPLDFFRRCWSPRLAAHLREAVRWGWFALRKEPECRSAFERLVANPIGLAHEELIGSKRSTQASQAALRAVAAAAAIGAARFTGWRWEPTMFGLYLLDDPHSWLNSPTCRGL